MRDKTQPVSPPPGLKWRITDSTWFHYAHDLGLYPADGQPQAHALIKLPFTDPSEVRALSKIAIRKLRAEQERDSAIDSLRKRFP